MIRSYNDHAANERTFLAWVRTGISAIALGVVVEKGSLVSLMIAEASSSMLIGHARECFGGYCGPVLVGTGIAVMLGASLRFVLTALRIDDGSTHTAAIVRVASALLHRRRREDDAIESVSSAANAGSLLKQTSLLRHIGRTDLTLVRGTKVSQLDYIECDETSGRTPAGTVFRELSHSRVRAKFEGLMAPTGYFDRFGTVLMTNPRKHMEPKPWNSF